MKAQDLKNSILQLAIQGKLVEQREEEGTAKELIEQIQAEKEKLIKEKKIKKEKPLTEITEDEIPFDIPESWEWVKLEQLATITGGYAFKSTNYTEQGVRVIRISDFNERGFVDNKIVRHPYDDSLEMFLLEKNNILLCMTGGTVGKSLFVKEIDEPMITNQRVATIKICHGLLPEYINYIILSSIIQNIIRISKNSTNDNISMDTIKRFPIPLPPLEEQKRIVAKIEELMPYVDKYDVAYSEVEKLNKKFPEDMQKSILQYAIQGKLVEQREEDGTAEDLYKQIQEEKKKLIKEGKIKKTKVLPEITEDEIPFDIPENWKWVRLGEIGSWSSGATPSRSNPKYYGGEIPWLKTGDLNDGYIVEVPEYITEEALNKTSVRLNPIGSILMAMYGATIGKLGILDIEATTNQACCACIPFKGIYNKFLFYYLLGQRGYYIKMGAGGAQPNISKEKIVSSILPLPPLAEQKRIVEKIEEMLPYTKQLIKKID